MSLRTCIETSQRAGHLTVDEANDLYRRLDQLTRQILSPAIVRQTLIKEMEAIAQERKRINLLTEGRRNVLQPWLLGNQSPAAAFFYLHAHNGEVNVADVHHLARSIEAQAKSKIEDMLNEFRRGAITGDLRRQFNTEVKARMDNVVRELFGQNTGDIKAVELARALSETFEELRVRFNDAGGAIGKLKNWGGPQIHDPMAMRNAGKQAWINYITPRLDHDRMIHPFTNQKMTAQEIADSLDHIWETITSDGWNTRDPSGQQYGKGALFKQHADHRFLHFKNADTWIEYQKEFGSGDIFSAFLGHIHTMAKDIAAMEVFGPNPEAMRTYLKGVVSKASGNSSSSIYNNHRADELWAHLRGAAQTPVSIKWANVMGNIRNVISSAALGSAAITSVADLSTQTARRLFNGLPSHKLINEMVAYLAKPENRREAVRAALDLDAANSMIEAQARYVGALGGQAWSRYIADRVLTVSGLSPWTQAGKHVFGRAIQGHLADEVGKTFAQMIPATRRMLERHGIDEAGWNAIRAAQLHEPQPGATYLRPAEIAQLPGGRDLADKYVAMIMRETTFAIPEATPASQSILGGATRPGTWAGEMSRSVMQFKGFPIAFLTLHGGQVMRMLWTPGQRIAGGVYAGGLLIGMTLMGAVALQLKEIIAGRDPRKMTPTDKQGAKFWLAAMQQGGGLGIFGDFLFADVNRFGGSAAGTLGGPLVGKFEDLLKLSIGNLRELGEGKERTNFGREAVNFLKTNTPGQSLWFARLAWERLFFDQLQYLADPEAHTSWQRRMQHRKTEFGNEFWWKPGQTAPARGPDLGKMGG